MSNVQRWEWLALSAILVLALTLRLYQLDAPLWYDEVFTLTHFIREPWPQLLSDFSSLNNHMGYSILAKLSVGLFGENAVALRLPAIAFALGSLVLFWWMVREPAGSVNSLVAVLLSAISYHHIWFSQNARGYTEMLFFTTLATMLLLHALKHPTYRNWTFYGLAIALSMYTHLSSGFFLAAHGLVCLVLLIKGRAGPKVIYGFAIGGLFTLILYAPLLPQIMPAMHQVSDGKTSSTMAEWTNPLRTLREMSAGFGTLGPLVAVLIPGALVAIATGAVALARRAPTLTAAYVLAVPIILVILMVLSFRIWPRYFFVEIQFLLLCAVIGCRTVAKLLATLLRWPTESQLFALAVVAMLAGSLALLPKNYLYPKQDFTGAIRFFEANRRQGDQLTALGLAAEPISSYFLPGTPAIKTAEDLSRLRTGAFNVWILTAFDDHVDPDQASLLAKIQKSATEVEEFNGTLGGGEVRLYQVPGLRQSASGTAK